MDMFYYYNFTYKVEASGLTCELGNKMNLKTKQINFIPKSPHRKDMIVFTRMYARTRWDNCIRLRCLNCQS